jgi:hypothetical protein
MSLDLKMHQNLIYNRLKSAMHTRALSVRALDRRLKSEKLASLKSEQVASLKSEQVASLKSEQVATLRSNEPTDIEKRNRFFSKLVKQTEKRSRLESFKYDISVDWITHKFYEQQMRCSICGKEMTTFLAPKARARTEKRPFRLYPLNASIDQTRHSLGYTKDNVQLTHVTCNLSKLDLSMEDFVALCSNVSDFHGKRK